MSDENNNEDAPVRHPRYQYFKDYYAKNKKRIAQQRSHRYKNDPIFRANTNERRRKAALRKRQIKRNKLGFEGSILDRGKEMKIISPCGTKSHVCKLYTIGMIADLSGIRKTQIYSWINKNRIPMSHYTTPKGWRLYTRYELDILVRWIKSKKISSGLEGYIFRWTKEYELDIKEKLSHLVGGVPPHKFK